MDQIPSCILARLRDKAETEVRRINPCNRKFWEVLTTATAHSCKRFCSITQMRFLLEFTTNLQSVPTRRQTMQPPQSIQLNCADCHSNCQGNCHLFSNSVWSKLSKLVARLLWKFLASFWSEIDRNWAQNCSQTTWNFWWTVQELIWNCRTSNYKDFNQNLPRNKLNSEQKLVAISSFLKLV